MVQMSSFCDVTNCPQGQTFYEILTDVEKMSMLDWLYLCYIQEQS